MNLLNSQSQKHFSSKHNKKRLTQHQVSILEASFNSNNKLEPQRKLELSRELSIPPRQIAIWYQNKRARWKSQRLELEYDVIQTRLETALAEKKQLEKEVEWLRVELHKAQDDMLVALKSTQTQPHVISSISNEGGSSGLNNDVNCSWVNEVENLYGYFMAANGLNCGSKWENPNCLVCLEAASICACCVMY